MRFCFPCCEYRGSFPQTAHLNRNSCATTQSGSHAYTSQEIHLLFISNERMGQNAICVIIWDFHTQWWGKTKASLSCNHSLQLWCAEKHPQCTTHQTVRCMSYKKTRQSGFSQSSSVLYLSLHDLADFEASSCSWWSRQWVYVVHITGKIIFKHFIFAFTF